MWLQLLLIIIAFVVLQIIQGKGDSPKQKHKYVVFLTIMLILQSALRHLAVGADTYAYYLKFLEVQNESWNSIFREMYETYILNEGKDAGFKLLEKCFSTIIPSFRIFMFFVAICFFIPFCRLAEKITNNCSQLFLFFCLYQAIFYDFFSVTGLRQALATVALFIGVKHIENNKLIRFLIIALIASLIHKSALMIIPFFFIAKLPKSKYVLLIAMLVLPFVIPRARELALLMAEVSSSDQYMYYIDNSYETRGAQNFLLFLAGGSLLITFAKWRNNLSIPDLFVNACALGLFFAPLTWVDPTLMRVGQYFSLLALLAIPIAIDNLGADKRTRNLVYYGLVLLMAATIVRHSADYTFFWNEMQLGDNYGHIIA